MVKKEKKSKLADKRARVAAKTEKKTKQKAKKNAKKNVNDSESDDQDIDAILEEYEKKQALHMAIHEAIIPEPPTVRSNTLLVPSPSNTRELFMFGGELVSGTPPTAKFFNDLYCYHTERNEWRQITSGNSPLPRSGAAMTQGGTGKPELWMFGGEFSSRNFNIYFHYSDFWKLDTDTKIWEKIDVKGTPTGRSGHRMSYWKNYIILFGGFQATSPTTTKYLDDVHFFNTTAHTWHAMSKPAAHIPYPPARSSYSFLPHEQGAVIFGGYSRVKIASKENPSARKQKVGAPVKDTPVHHVDSWLLKIDATEITKSRWEKRKKPGNLPNPPRVGITMAHHRGRGVLFGGVYDEEHKDEDIESKFFDEMWVWGIVQNRFWETKMRKLRKQNVNANADEKGQGNVSRRDRAKQDEIELLKNLALLEEQHELQPTKWDMTADIVEEVVPVQVPIELSLSLPLPRFNAALAVQNDVLYIYGGSFEKGDVEITYDEMYKINLEKLDGCGKIWSRDHAVGGEDEMDEDDDEEGSDDDEDDSDSEEEYDSEEEEKKRIAADKRKQAAESGSSRKPKKIQELQEKTPDTPATSVSSEPDLPDAPESTLPLPRPFESLKLFFQRTSNDFQNVIMQALLFKPAITQENTSVKEIRTQAFEMAEARWWECREEVREREEELEEMGVGDQLVMTGEEKSGGTAGNKRR